MRHSVARLSITTLFLICSLLATAANTHYSYILLSSQDGYPSEVKNVFQEHRGYVWFCASDGLYRLGNGSITPFAKGYPHGYLLPSDDIYDATRHDAIFWTLTSAGLMGCEGNPVTGVTPIYPAPTVIAHSCITTEDGIFFGGENAVYTFDAASHSVIKVADIPVSGSLTITDMFVWLDGGIVLFDRNGNDIFMLYPKTGMVARFPFQCSARDEYFSRFFIDSQFNIWLSRHGQGVERYSRDGELIASYNAASGNLSKDIVNCFLENGNEVWVGTESGITVIDRRTNKVTILKKDTSDPLSLPGSSITNLAKGENGTIWASRNRGGVILIHKSEILAIRSEEIADGISEGVTAIYQDEGEADVWIGTDGAGILRFNPVSETLTSYPSTIGHDIYAICGYREGQLLLSCASEGIFVFDKRSGEMWLTSMIESLRYRIRNGEKACLMKLDNNRVIALSDLVYSWNFRNNTYARFPLPPDVEPGTLHAVYGSEGKYLYDSFNIFKMDTESLAISDFVKFEDGGIESASMAPDGSIWAIHGDNLLHVNTETGTYHEHIPQFEACRNPDILVCASDSTVWIGARNNLIAYMPGEDDTIFFDEMDGVISNLYETHARLLDKTGNLYLGGINGFVKVGRDFKLASDSVPEIELTDVIADGQVTAGDIVLEADHNTLILNVLARDADAVRAKLFRFIVEGPDGVSEYEQNRPELVLKDLAAGKYVIDVSCTTHEGHWTDIQTICEFRIRTPWYKSTVLWFFIILLIVGGGSLLVYMLLKQQKMRTDAKMQQSVIRGEEQRMNFLTDVSHELRTPLTLILGPLERMIKKNEYVEPAKLVSVYRNAERIKILLNTILTAEKIEDGQSPAYLETHNINRWIRSVAANFEDEVRARGLELKLELDPTLSSADIDTGKCFIVISNIILNAIKVCPEGTSITVGTLNLPDTDSYRVFVSDSGPGVKVEALDQVFGKYYQETEDKTGFGVGLSYSKAIIDSLNGKISAYNNTPDKGATFYFDLPNKA